VTLPGDVGQGRDGVHEDFASQGRALRRLPTDTLWPLRTTHPAAREELIRRNLPLARKLAARYRNPHEPYEDLVQVASLALVKAVTRFDPDFGRPFNAFATPTILGELKRHFRDTGWMAHVPRSAQELAQRTQKAAKELYEHHGRSATVLELARHLQTDIESVVEALEADRARYAASMDAPLKVADSTEGDTATLHDWTGSDDDGYALTETSSSILSGIPRLPNDERRALILRLDHELTQSEIARRLGCSQMHVSRLLTRAAARLRDELDAAQPATEPTVGARAERDQ
jgi:RNA polymerase sigma-B factor